MRSQHQIIAFQDTTILTTTTASVSFLMGEMNDVEIGIPVYTFSNPSLDYITAKTELILKDATLVNAATSYGAAIAFTVNSSAAAIPIYQIVQTDTDGLPQIATPTVVQDLTATGTYFAARINEVVYGIPLYSGQNRRLRRSHDCGIRPIRLGRVVEGMHPVEEGRAA